VWIGTAAHRVEVGDVHTVLVRLGAVRAILLYIEREETHVEAIALLKSEQCLRLVRELFGVRIIERLLVFHELLRRIRGHQQRRDDAYGDRLARDADSLEIGGDCFFYEVRHGDAC
jgi:hypothetical protein